MLEKPVSRLYFAFLLPTVIATISNSLYCLADIYFISIGSGMMGLAAVNIAMPMYLIYSAIGLLFGVGASTIISIEQGAGNHKGADEAFTMSVIMMLLFGIILTILSYFFLEPLAVLLGASDELLPYVMEYLRPVVLATIAFIAMYACGILLRADHAPRLAMTAMLVGNISNIFLDYFFVIVLQKGLGGAAAATALAPLITLVIVSFHFILKRNHLHLCRVQRPLAILKRMTVNGAGSGILELTSGAIIFLFNAVILAVSTAAFLAAYAIVANIAYVLKGLFAAFGQAAQPIMSYNYGAGKKERTRKALHISMLTALGASLLLYVSFALFPRELAAIFAGGDAAVITLAVTGILLYFTSMPFTAFNTILMYYFQSVEKGRFATILAVLKGSVFVVLSLAVAYWLLGDTGIWLAVLLAEALAAAVGMLIDRRCRRKEPL